MSSFFFFRNLILVLIVSQTVPMVTIVVQQWVVTTGLTYSDRWAVGQTSMSSECSSLMSRLHDALSQNAVIFTLLLFCLFYGKQCARLDMTITEKIQSCIHFIYQNQKDLFSLCSVIEISSVS